MPRTKILLPAMLRTDQKLVVLPGGRVAGWVAGWVYELKIRLNSASVGVELKLKLKLSLAITQDCIKSNFVSIVKTLKQALSNHLQSLMKSCLNYQKRLTHNLGV